MRGWVRLSSSYIELSDIRCGGGGNRWPWEGNNVVVADDDDVVEDFLCFLPIFPTKRDITIQQFRLKSELDFSYDLATI